MLICGHCGGLVKSLLGLAVHLRCEEKPQELVVVENTSTNIRMDDITLKDLESYAVSFAATTLCTVCDSRHAVSQFIKFLGEQQLQAAIALVKKEAGVRFDKVELEDFEYLLKHLAQRAAV